MMSNCTDVSFFSLTRVEAKKTHHFNQEARLSNSVPIQRKSHASLCPGLGRISRPFTALLPPSLTQNPERSRHSPHLIVNPTATGNPSVPQ
jgi:hypothetical protein